VIKLNYITSTNNQAPRQPQKQQTPIATQSGYLTRAKATLFSAKDKIYSVADDIFKDIFNNANPLLVFSSLTAGMRAAMCAEDNKNYSTPLLFSTLLFGGATLQVGIQNMRKKKHKRGAALTALGGIMTVASAYFIYPNFFPSKADEIRAMIQRDKENQTPCQVLDLFPARDSALRRAYENSELLSLVGLAGACAHMDATEISSFVNNLNKEIHPDKVESEELKKLATEAIPAIKHAYSCIKIKKRELKNLANEDLEDLFSNYSPPKSLENRICNWAGTI